MRPICSFLVGVDQTSACSHVYLDDDKLTKTKCPLTAGQTYIYKNSFKVLEIYPKISLVVHWALTTPEGHTATCFELPAKIV